MLINSLKPNKSPRASILIRTRNEEITIKKLIDSLLEQSEKDFEIILVDNNSTDQTLNILKKYNIVPDIEIPEGKFSHPLSLNSGITLCKSNLVVITNGHCLPMTKTWLSDGLKNFEDPKVAGISGHYYDHPGAKPRYQIIFDAFYFLFSIVVHKRFETVDQKVKINYDKNLTNTNSIIRKDRWEKYHFDENLKEGCEDYDWASEMIARGYNIIKDPKFSVYHTHVYRHESAWQGLKRIRLWRRICGEIDQKKRPSKFVELN